MLPLPTLATLACLNSMQCDLLCSWAGRICLSLADLVVLRQSFLFCGAHPPLIVLSLLILITCNSALERAVYHLPKESYLMCFLTYRTSDKCIVISESKAVTYSLPTGSQILSNIWPHGRPPRRCIIQLHLFIFYSLVQLNKRSNQSKFQLSVEPVQD